MNQFVNRKLKYKAFMSKVDVQAVEISQLQEKVNFDSVSIINYIDNKIKVFY